MKIFWFTEFPGISIFMRVGKMYLDEHGTYPTSMDEFPKYLNRLGYDVKPVMDYGTIINNEKMGQRFGIAAEDDVATLLLLRFG